MSRAGKILRQSLHSGLFYVVYTVSRLLLAVALGKGITSQTYGSYSLITATIGTGSILLLRADQYYVREVPGRPRRKGASIFKSIVLTQTMLLAAFLILLAAVAPIREATSRLLGLPEGGMRLFAAIGILLMAESLASEFNRYFYARKEIEKGNMVSLLQTSLWPIAAFLVFLLKPKALNLPFILEIWFASLLLAVLYGLYQAGIKSLWKAPFKPMLYPAAIRFGSPLVLMGAMTYAGWFGRFILAGHYSTEVVGIFSYHYNIILMIAALSSPLVGGPLEPYVIEAYNRGETTRSGYLLGAMLRYRVLLVMPLLIVAAAWSHSLIRLMARSDYLGVGNLIALLTPVPVLAILNNTFERVLFLGRRTGAIARCYLVAAGLQVGLMAWLIPLNPYLGAAAATDIGMLVLTAMLWLHSRGIKFAVAIPAGRLGLTALCGTALALTVARAISPMPLLLLLGSATLIVSAAVLLFACLFGVLSGDEIRTLRGFVSRAGQQLLFRPA